MPGTGRRGREPDAAADGNQGSRDSGTGRGKPDRRLTEAPGRTQRGQRRCTGAHRTGQRAVMLRTRTGATGSLASGAATANYILQEQLRPENIDLAEYLG